MLIDGIYIPLSVPFTRDGASYLRKLEYNVGRYSLTPAAGMVALTGEGAALSEEETRDVLRVVGEAAGAEKVLVAAASKSTVRGALEIAEQAAEVNFDALLLAAPPDWAEFTARGGGEGGREISAELMLFFRAVADASPLPVFLWSDASAMGFEFSIEMIRELAQHPNIRGLFDGRMTSERYAGIVATTKSVRHDVTVTSVFAPVTGRMQHVAGAGSLLTAGALASGAPVKVAASVGGLRTRVKSVGFQVMAAGQVLHMADLLEAGVAGSMPTLAACAPQACCEVYAAFKDGDPALAAEKQDRVQGADGVIREFGIAGVKYGCDLNGYYGGSVRLPRVGLDGSQMRAVEKALAGLRN